MNPFPMNAQLQVVTCSLRNKLPSIGYIASFYLCSSLSMTLLLSGCAESVMAIRAENKAAPNSIFQEEVAVPNSLRGVWYPEDTEGRASCRTYLATDASTIERTGHDPLVGVVVISRKIIHRYSEHGEGNFFVVSQVKHVEKYVWALSGQLFLDYLPGEGGRGADFFERFDLSENGAALSSSEDFGGTLFRCGDVRDDLYLAK